MVCYTVAVTLHGPEAEAGTVSRVYVDALTVAKVRAAYPFAGRFHFRVKRAEGGDGYVWEDLVGDPDAPFDVDDPRTVELRALCVDADDETWDGPVAPGPRPPRASTDAVRERVGATVSAAKIRAAELRDKVKTNETVQRVQSKTKEMRDKLNSHRQNVTGKLSQWLDR